MKGKNQKLTTQPNREKKNFEETETMWVEGAKTPRE